MAWMNQEKKAKIAAELKKVNKRYPDLGVKYTLAVRHHMAIVMKIRSAKVDLIDHVVKTNPNWFRGDHQQDMDVNLHWLEKQFSGRVLEYFEEIKAALNTDNHDRSDILTDYFDVGHYVDVKIGEWDKPFVVAA